MDQSVRGDAERLQEIQRLGNAIAAKQPALRAAREKRAAAQATVSDRMQAVKAVESDIRSIAKEVRFKGTGTYLNGQSFDRVTVEVGNEECRVRGWHGSAAIPLDTIVSLEVGASLLPPRVGIPFVARLFPGKPRNCQTLILKANPSTSGDEQIAVIAGLSDAQAWIEQIITAQGQLGDVAARRSSLETEKAARENALADAKHALSAAQAELDPIESEVAVLESQKKKLEQQQRELEAAREKARKAELEALKTKGQKK